MNQFFYMRVSTQGKNKEGEDKQNFDRQIGIFERSGYVLTEENTFAEHISGKTKADERKEFDRMLSQLSEGDTVYFSETSRFSRSYVLGMEMIDTLIFDCKVNVVFVSNGITLEAGEKYNPYQWYTLSQMLLTDELQRRIIGYNTANALKAKKEQGIRLGRDSQYGADVVAQIEDMTANGMSVRAIANELGMSASTVSRIKNGQRVNG